MNLKLGCLKRSTKLKTQTDQKEAGNTNHHCQERAVHHYSAYRYEKENKEMFFKNI